MRSIVAGLALLLLGACAQVGADLADPLSRDVSRTDALADLDQALTFVRATHPALEAYADLSAVEATRQEIAAGLGEPSSLRETWAAFARLNPAFGDAHTGIRVPEAPFESYVAGGGRPFPLRVEIIGDQIIAAATAEGGKINKGDRILAINGLRAEQILADLRPRMRGEGPALQDFVLATRFDRAFWALYGPATSYRVRVEAEGRRRTVHLTAGPEAAEPQDPEDTPFAFRQVGDDVGLLTIDSFAIRYEAAFKDYLLASFREIQSRKLTTLIIDLRANGGGAHDLSDPLLGYLTDQRFSPTARITARITPENIARLPGTELGQVVTVPFPQWVDPADNPLRFAGDVYVLIGARTYSQAIVFATIIQDFGIGTLVGEETQGAADQTGQTQMLKLDKTGLRVQAPIYVFHRAQPGELGAGVVPDIPLPDDLSDPEAMVNALISKLGITGQVATPDASP